jgi:hypothetical protein
VRSVDIRSLYFEKWVCKRDSERLGSQRKVKRGRIKEN